MSPAMQQGAMAPPRPTQLALRLAQRAFAALIDHQSGHRGSAQAWRGAQLRSLAQRTLPALSADDRADLARWLALQFAVRDADPGSCQLARIDTTLCTQTVALLGPAHLELTAPRRASGAAVA